MNLNAHLTISIWNSFGPQTKQYRELNKINALMDFAYLAAIRFRKMAA